MSSSTTRTRGPSSRMSADAPSWPTAGLKVGSWATTSGRTKRNTLPLPNSLSTRIQPPCSSTNLLDRGEDALLVLEPQPDARVGDGDLDPLAALLVSDLGSGTHRDPDRATLR